MNKQILEKYVVEYSQSQKQFHVTTLEDAINTNRRHIMPGTYNTDYKIIGVFDTHFQAHALIGELLTRLPELKNPINDLIAI